MITLVGKIQAHLEHYCLDNEERKDQDAENFCNAFEEAYCVLSSSKQDGLTLKTRMLN